jgi:cold shock CspA family protein
MSEQERIIGSELGQVKWFDNKLGYGFVTVLTNKHKDKDIFAHQTNVFPLETEYRTLSKGEYISLNVSEDAKIQAMNVTGVLGGSLRCDEPRPLPRGGGGGGRRDKRTDGATDGAVSAPQ